MRKIKTEIKWALVFVGVSLLWMWLEKAVGLHSTHIDKHMYYTNLFFIPAIAIYVLALSDKKKNNYSGRMNYKQGVVSALKLSAIITAFAPLSQYAISEFITPEYFPNVIAYALRTGYFKTRAAAEAYFNLGNYIQQSLIGAAVMGLLFSLVLPLFVRSKQQPPPGIS